MIPSIGSIHEKFRQFNKQMFGGVLKSIPVEITTAKNYLGYIKFKKDFDESGKLRFYDYIFRFSARYDMPENEWDDILIHEMIHYFIAYQGLTDNTPHGKLFKQKMKEINARFQRNITISRKNTEVVSVIKDSPKIANNTKKRTHVIAFVRLKDGRVGIKVLPRKIDAISAFYDYFSKHEKIESVKLYFCSDPFFSKFPMSSKIYAHIVDEKEVMKHLEHGTRFELKDGNIFPLIDASKFQWK